MDATSTEATQNHPRIIPEKPEWLSAGFANLAIDPVGGVDRDANIIRGYVVAQEGPFLNEWRGEFDKEGLSTIASLINSTPQGVKCRFTHPTMSDDGLGKFLGRTKEAFLGTTINRNGETIACVRANLYFDSTALDTPPSGGKPLGIYVMDLAESDSNAISSSIVCKKEEEYRLNPDGTRQKDAEGYELPPLWKVKELHASDIVDEGDAVDGLLSSNSSERLAYLKGAELLNKAFSGQSREVIESRCTSFLSKYLNSRYGDMGSKKLSHDSMMQCPECETEYSNGEKYCPMDGTKLEPKSEMEQMQNSKPHGDEKMSKPETVKPAKPDEGKEPEKLTAEQAELVRLREELTSRDEKIASLTSELEDVKPLASKVVALEGQVAELNANNDRMALNALLDGELFHKWRTDERDKLASHLLKLKAVSEELYKEGLDEVRNRADVKPQLSQVAGHVQNDGNSVLANDQLIEKHKEQLRKTMPNEKNHVILRKATSAAMKDPAWVKEA